MDLLERGGKMKHKAVTLGVIQTVPAQVMHQTMILVPTVLNMKTKRGRLKGQFRTVVP